MYKLYVANKKYFSINRIIEKYFLGNKYLEFHIPNTALSYEFLTQFFSDPSNFATLQLVDDKNQLLKTWDNIYHALHRMEYNYNIGGENTVIVRLTSSVDGMENVDF